MTADTSEPKSDNQRALENAFHAYEEGLLPQARGHLRLIDVQSLSPPDRYRAQSLIEELGEISSDDQLEEEYSTDLEDLDPLGALQRARRLAETAAEPGKKDSWQRRCEELRERIGQHCQLEVSTETTSLEDCLKLGFYYQRSHIWLDDEGQHLVIVNAFDDWLFIRLVNLETHLVVARVSLKPPEPLVRPLITCLDGDHLWITGSRGGLLEIQPSSWKILGWYSPADFISDDYSIEATIPFPGGSHLWMEVRSPDDEPETLVIDLKAWRLERKLPGGLVSLIPLVGPETCQVIYSSDELGTRLYSQQGTLPGPERILSYGISAAAVSPDGQGILLMVGRAAWHAETGRLAADAPEVKDRLKDKGEILVLIEPTASGGSRVVAELDLGVTLPLGDRRLATSIQEGLCFALVTRDRHEEEILAIAVHRDSEARFEILYRLRVPYGAMLLRDRRSQHAVALVFSGQRVQLARLGHNRPEHLEREIAAPRTDIHLPSVDGSQLCGNPTGDVLRGVERLMEPMKLASFQELELMVDELEKQEGEIEIEHLIYLCLALRKSSYMVREKLDLYIKKLAERHPDHPAIALLRAESAAELEAWPEVHQLLIGIEPKGLDDGRTRHFFHLLGLALLHHERPDEAHRAFENAALYEQGDCDLQALNLLTQPMGDPPEDLEWDADQPRIRQILGALHTVDRQVATNQSERARSLLEQTHLWQISEQQMTARLAAIYLDTSVSTSTERFYKRLALARFCFIRGLDERFFRKELLLPGLTWGQKRLEELEERIRDWLDDG